MAFEGRTRVFISYSHKDQVWLDRLKDFLEPLSSFEIEVWDDASIEPGDDWFEKIERALNAADVAVLLVTQDFIASDFIQRVELRRLIERRQAEELPMLWIPVSASLYECTSLESIQATSAPRKPLAGMRPYKRDEALKKVALTVQARAEKRAAELRARGDQQRLERAATPVHHSNQHSAVLSIDLEVRERAVRVRYRSPPDHEIGEPVQAQWSESSNSDGEALFQLLFPEARVQRAVMEALFGAPEAPVRRALRVRITTRSASIACLPWWRASWRGSVLARSGWTFEVVSADSRAEVTLRPPCRTLILVANEEESRQHVADLRHELAVVCGGGNGCVRTATSLESLEEALSDYRPDIVYYFGPADIRSLELVFNWGAESVSWLRLQHVLSSHPPLVVYLNCCPPQGSRLNVLLNGTAAATILRVEAPPEERVGAETAMAWFKAVLTEGLDPVTALSRLPGRVVDTLVAFGAYERWSTQANESAGRPTIAGPIAMDRDMQRAMVDNAVRKLMEDRRTTAIVAYAEPGNCLELFSEQALNYITRTGAARASPFFIPFPRLHDNFKHGFQRELRSRLEINPGESFSQALHRIARPRFGGSPTLVWFNWGVVREDQPLPRDALRGWLDFTAWLAHECGQSQRVVNYVAIERPIHVHGELVTILDDHGQLLCENNLFGCQTLHPLGKVSRVELASHLSSSACNCPHGMASKLAELLWAATHGNYEQTYELLQYGHRAGWEELRNRVSGVKRTSVESSKGYL